MFETKYNIKLNEKQKKAMLHLNNPALTLAIPGSGKTTLLLCRIYYLHSINNIKHENILTLTFSKASANDLENRYKKLFHNLPSDLQFSTIHKFSYKIVRKYYQYRNVNFTLIEGKNAFLKINILKNAYKLINNSIISNEDLEILINDISYVNNSMLKTEYPSNIKNFDKIYDSYKLNKKQHKYIDFDDMLLICLRVLEKHKNILDFYSDKYKYIQVDEAQDTSIVQHKIIALLCKKHNNIFMVADDDQSIYGFRGAYPKFLLDFKIHYNNATIYYLNENYRSSFQIIDTCNNFISKNNNRYKKEINNTGKKNNNINIIEFLDINNRNKYIINSIQLESKSIAILYRNNISAINIINLLEKENFEFNIKGKNSNFFNHWLVNDIKAFFNLILINQDLDSFEKIYYKLNSYISKNMIEYLNSNIRGRSVFDCLIENPKLKKFQKDTFRKLKSIFLSARAKEPLEIINIIKYELNYLNYLDEFANKSNNNYSNLKNKLQVLESIASEESSAFEFLNRLDKLNDYLKNHSNNNNDKITLSTIHSAKGLEFDHVFIIDINDDVLPQTIETIEEDRRLLYVALSRARVELSIMHSKFISGKFNDKITFINELKKIKYVDYKIYKEKNNFNYELGEIVNHKQFGTGKIINITKNNISIEFKNSLKILSKNICIKQNLLTK
jgi:DNA helicase-2/ATP-dependent DNA helicase PcrA